jgi:hypothetical protein
MTAWPELVVSGAAPGKAIRPAGCKGVRMLTKIAIVLALLIVFTGMLRNRKSERPSRTTNVLLGLIVLLLAVSIVTHFIRLS